MNCKVRDTPLKQRGSSSIDIPPALMATFFEPLFEKIKAKVKELLEKANEKKAPVGFIFMVGGFSESPFLKTEIKKTFETPELQVIESEKDRYWCLEDHKYR